MTRRRALFVFITVVALAGFAALVQRILSNDPAYDDRPAARVLLNELDAESPLGADLDLPRALHAEALRKPHPRIELGKKELRAFGHAAQPMPPASAFMFPSSELTTIGMWGDDVLRDAGADTRTLELAVDRDVAFGLVVSAIMHLDAAGLAAKLFLVENADRTLGVFKPSPGVGSAMIRIDLKGARLTTNDGKPMGCEWAVSSDASAFGKCVYSAMTSGARDAGAAGENAHDADAISMLQLLIAVGQDPLVTLYPAAVAHYADVITVVDGLAGEHVAFALAFDRSQNR
ncbi:hypothetical protein BH09MYX1_BH09MYX1_39390 [soil metagenome]